MGIFEELENKIQKMREDGETDMRTVIDFIKVTKTKVQKIIEKLNTNSLPSPCLNCKKEYLCGLSRCKEVEKFSALRGYRKAFEDMEKELFWKGK